MAQVIGVRFRKAGKVYYFDPSGLALSEGYVVVETAHGTECGELVKTAHEVPDDQVVLPLRKAVRQATPQDEQRMAEREQKQAEALRICEEKIAAHGLDMKLVDVEIAFDGTKIIFYFTAEGRVDFRELVKDLAHVFRTRIELRQIGVRDEAKMLGGLGACGRVCCCNAFLREFQPVSIRMAKEQNLSLNPTKISGLCGRLMCCLKYESDTYEAARKRMPKVGREVLTPDGVGTVVENNVLKENSRVRVMLEDGTLEMRHYPLDELNRDPEAIAKASMPRPVQQRPARTQERRENNRERSKGVAQQQEKVMVVPARVQNNARPAGGAERLVPAVGKAARAQERPAGGRGGVRMRPAGGAPKPGAKTEQEMKVVPAQPQQRTQQHNADAPAGEKPPAKRRRGSRGGRGRNKGARKPGEAGAQAKQSAGKTQ